MFDEETPNAFFPRSYVTSLFKMLNANPDKIQILTYKDFCWGDDCNHKAGYLDEWRSWRRKLITGQLSPEKIYLLVQYDVDARPERTMALLRDDAHRGIPANIMIFGQRPNRDLLFEQRRIEYTDYEIDDELLRELEKSGSVVGYHFNVFERSGWNPKEASQLFQQDLGALRKRFNIEFCSAHGGISSEDGKNNNSIELPAGINPPVRWVHNRYSPRFDGQFSDGGHLKSKIDPAERDIRDFVRSWRLGGRYRLLIHPQYYDREFTVSPTYARAQWYKDMVAGSLEPALPGNDFGYELSPAATPHASVTPDLDIPEDGRVLADSVSALFAHKHPGSAKNVSFVKEHDQIVFPDIDQIGYVLIGGGSWHGAKQASPGVAFFRTKVPPVPGGWPANSGCYFALNMSAVSLSAGLDLSVKCISYDVDGEILDQQDLGRVNEAALDLDELFVPARDATSFNLAIYKAKSDPGGVAKFSRLNLVCHKRCS